MAFRQSVGATSWVFPDLKTLMAKATPLRSGDMLAGVAAAQHGGDDGGADARWPICRCATFLNEALVPYEEDEVTRLIVDTPRCRGLRAGRLADRRRVPRLALLRRARRRRALAALAPGVTPEMAAAVSQADAQPGPDPGRAQMPRRHALPQHDRPARHARRAPAAEPSDRRRCAASPPRSSTGCCYGCGDAVIGINPASDSMSTHRRPAAPARRGDRPLRDPDAGLRADPCHHRRSR